MPAAASSVIFGQSLKKSCDCFLSLASAAFLVAIQLATGAPRASLAQVILDPTFGSGGIVTTDFGGAYDDLEEFSVGPAGEIFATGTGGSGNRFAIVKYLPNGQLDATFSGDGKASISSTFSSSALVAQPDGAVLVATGGIREPRGFLAARFLANGDLDASYNSTGDAQIPTGSQVFVKEVGAMPDGKLLIGGYNYFDADVDWDFVVARILPSGLPDASFGINGSVRTDFSRTAIDKPSDFMVAMLQQPDGKIIAGGLTSTSAISSTGNRIHAMVRYLPDGSLDPDFGDGGKNVFTFETGRFQREVITALEWIGEGKFLATSGGGSETALMRFNEDGSLDPSFGDGGRVYDTTGDSWRNPSELTIDQKGRILTVNSDFSVSRFLSNGTLDKTFGDEGTFRIDFPLQTSQWGTSIAWQDENLLLVGGYTVETPNVHSEWRIVRLDFSGEIPEPSALLLAIVLLMVLPGGGVPLHRRDNYRRF